MSQQQAGFIDTDVQEKQYPDPEWIEVYQPLDMMPKKANGDAPTERRVVRVTKKALDGVYADRGYELVESKKEK